jgi:Ca2+-transporting ATPase
LENDRAIEWLKTLALALLILGIGIGVGALFQWLPASIQQWMPAAAAHQLLTYFTIAVTIIVVAVPEGLALSVTLSLAYSMRKMTQQNNLVRRMNACETIGAATVICSDKTGTLTLNEMRVRETNFPSLRDENISPLIAEAIAANTTANLERNPGEKASPLGNPTEAALLLWLDKHHIDYAEKRGEFRIVERWAFSTDRKYMATLGKSPENGLILHVKGAPEILLDRCSQILTPEGIRPLSHVETITAELKDYQMRGMRTLGFATVSSPENYREEMDIDELAQEMTWVGCVAIADPIRPEVPKALATCKKASIRIKMVTGDNPNTAKEIARQIGLISDSEPSTSYLTGPQFSQLKAEEAKAAAQNVKVLARARPADKQRLVKLLQDSGEVVAVTGDGTNDAPALNQAQVGLALGKNSTFVAKEASDIIILDRAFESIETAVMWGRSLYQNIQKFILFQLTINVAACGIALLGPFIGINLPLTVTQLLWVNLIMDTFAALALATEPPSETVMEVPPRDPQDFIITKPMAIAIFTVAPIFLVFLLGFLLYIQEDGTVTKYELSLFFTTFVMLQFWNLFNAKCFGLNKSAFSNLFENKGFITIATVILLGQILMVQFGGSLFRTVPLSVQDWLMIIGGTSSVLWLGEAARFFARMKVRSSH